MPQINAFFFFQGLNFFCEALFGIETRKKEMLLEELPNSKQILLHPYSPSWLAFQCPSPIWDSIMRKRNMIVVIYQVIDRKKIYHKFRRKRNVIQFEWCKRKWPVPKTKILQALAVWIWWLLDTGFIFCNFVDELIIWWLAPEFTY